MRLLTTLLLFISFIDAQAQVRFVASTDAKQVVEGGYFNITFTLENARGSSFRAPSFVDFDVMSGPSQSTQMSIINGRTSQKMSYSYTLAATKQGVITIGSAQINAGGKTYQTQPIKVEVVKGNTTRNSSGAVGNNDETFVEIELNHDTAYIGQQLTIKYVLYTVLDVRSYNFTSLPSFDGFFAQEIQNYNERPQRIVRDGVQYIRRTLKVVSLYPQQKGVFILDPASLNVGIAQRGSRTSFFFNSNLKPLRLRTATQKISVLDLPPGAPQSYAGAIGQFYLGSAVDKKSITRDDAVTLTLQVRGDGDNKFIEAPTQPFSQHFDIYDPNLLKDEVSTVGDRVQTTKTYEYLMLPKHTGRITINPELSFFNPDSNRFETLKGQTYSINVLETQAREVATIEDDVEIPPVFDKISLQKRGQSLFSRPIYWLLNGTLGIALLAMLAVKGIQIKKSNIDPAVLRRSKARKMALKRLESAGQQLKNKDIKSFYIDLRKGLLDYLSDKINLPSSQLSKEALEKVLVENGLSDHTDVMIDIMKKGEMAIYASIPSGDEAQSFERAIQLIADFELAFEKNET